jgi:Uma2 family endonuclease
MTQPATKDRYTVAEYLRLERDVPEKHEFHDGEILAMSGGSPSHSLIASNTTRALGNRLLGKQCRVYESNLRIRIPRQDRYVYADGSVICGPEEFDPEDAKRETVVNPRLVVDVLSPSTEAYDRTKKFDYYRSAESFREYVLVSQESPRIETFLRQEDGTWAFDVAVGTGAIARLRSINLELPLSEVYANVEFPPATQSV